MLIFLAEPDQNLQLGLQMLLHQEAGMHVVGIAVDSNGLFVRLEASRADVLILDWQLPGIPTQDMLSTINELESPPKVVVLSVNPEVKELALSAGAHGFISKTAPPDDLLAVVRSVRTTSNSSN